jgi:glucokinase
VDVGGTKVAVAAIAGGAAHERVEHPTRLEGAEELLEGIEMAVAQVVERVGPPAAIGVGVPSQVDFATGRVMASVNIPLVDVPLREELGTRLAAPVFVDNDGNCAALAEAVATPESHQPAGHLVYLGLGTGVGGGLVLDGRIYRGASGLGGELGHVPIEIDGPECPGNCPNRGCLEAFCSGQALEREATETGRANPGSRLGAIVAERGVVKGREVVTLAREGDRDCGQILELLGRRLGVGIAGFLNVFEPEHVVIGGGLSRAADLFLDAARDEAAARALPSIVGRATISLARAGADAGLIGAGALAEQEYGAAQETDGRAPIARGDIR